MAEDMPGAGAAAGGTTAVIPGEMAARVDRLPMSRMAWQIALLVQVGWARSWVRLFPASWSRSSGSASAVARSKNWPGRRRAAGHIGAKHISACSAAGRSSNTHIRVMPRPPSRSDDRGSEAAPAGCSGRAAESADRMDYRSGDLHSPYILGRVGLLMFVSKTLFPLGVIFLAVGLVLEAGATGAVKAVRMSAKLVSGRNPAGKPSAASG
jgi:hypothetical protein